MSEFYKEIVQTTHQSNSLDRVKNTIKEAALKGCWDVNLGRHNKDQKKEVIEILKSEGFNIIGTGDFGLKISWKQ